MKLEDAVNAETIEDAFAGLVATAYGNNLEKGTPEWHEARKVFFCGAAFIASRIVNYSKSNEPEKVKELMDELQEFKNECLSIQRLHIDIANAGRYETTD